MHTGTAPTGSRHLLRLSAGQTIFSQDDPSDGRMYVVQKGQVRVERSGQSLDTLGPGQIFGEIGMLDERPRSATVTAQADTELLAVNADEFKAMLLRQPGLALDIMRILAARVRASMTAPVRGA